MSLDGLPPIDPTRFNGSVLFCNKVLIAVADVPWRLAPLIQQLRDEARNLHASVHLERRDFLGNPAGDILVWDVSS